MTDSPPARDDRTLERREDAREKDVIHSDQGHEAPDQHDEQPGFPDAPTGPAEGGD